MKNNDGTKMTNCFDIAKTLGLRYDGLMCGMFHQFTELNESTPSHGASFYVRINGQTLNTVAARQYEKQLEFAGKSTEATVEVL